MSEPGNSYNPPNGALFSAQTSGADGPARIDRVARTVLNAVSDALIVVDAGAQVTALNDSAERLTGWLDRDAVGKPLASLLYFCHRYSRQRLEGLVTLCLAGLERVCVAPDTLLVGRDGRETPIEGLVEPLAGDDGEVLGAVVSLTDVSTLQRLRLELDYRARHDALTGLSNRVEFERRLQRLLDDDEQRPELYALCQLDIDHFKLLNDTYGRDVGDELLRQLASTLSSQLRRADVLARLGGDEFGVLFGKCSAERAPRLAERLRAAVDAFRFVCQGQVVRVTASVGVVPVDGGTDAVTLLAAVDDACCTAKENGRNRVCAHRHDIAGQHDRREEQALLGELRRALTENAFELYAQPLRPLPAESGAPDDGGDRYEVLLRLRANDGELLLPEAFLSLAERYNLARDIDRWVINNTFAQLCRAAPGRSLTAQWSLNLSAQSLGDGGFCVFVEDQLDAYRIDARRICFEVTETAAIADLGRVAETMRRLAERGCRFALDGFGAGLWSFVHLRDLAVDVVKIDGRFVRRIADDAVDRSVLNSINEIAKVMGLQTVAGYVETDAVLRELQGVGVDYAQGFFLGEPRPISEAIARLRQRPGAIPG